MIKEKTLKNFQIVGVVIAAMSVGTAAIAEQHVQPAAAALVSGQDSALAGDVVLSTTASGRVLVQININGVPPGEHAIHLHETGDCSATDFKSAGGHISGAAQHGVLAQGGPHPGDMPNVTVAEDGKLKVDVFLDLLDIDSMVRDKDGAAFVIHGQADDYMSQPAGDAGPRIACGVFEQSS
ncbi:superoxide dismutase, Cu-Zn family [Sulfitobacter brevis]|uniref:Superoxide dismutase, Cu-Zn family n=1 Tax=Sulfitobacter brevis TaxID=74348 RepID=A0A1I2BGT4_9RHOB|nr:superoxide dismutase, Cu-Zn family [Sulfitobacter brevis]